MEETLEERLKLRCLEFDTESILEKLNIFLLKQKQNFQSYCLLVVETITMVIL